jgi:hypothetical protein
MSLQLVLNSKYLQSALDEFVVPTTLQVLVIVPQSQTCWKLGWTIMNHNNRFLNMHFYLLTDWLADLRTKRCPGQCTQIRPGQYWAASRDRHLAIGLRGLGNIACYAWLDAGWTLAGWWMDASGICDFSWISIMLLELADVVVCFGGLSWFQLKYMHVCGICKL